MATHMGTGTMPDKPTGYAGRIVHAGTEPTSTSPLLAAGFGGRLVSHGLTCCIMRQLISQPHDRPKWYTVPSMTPELYSSRNADDFAI